MFGMTVKNFFAIIKSYASLLLKYPKQGLKSIGRSFWYAKITGFCTYILVVNLLLLTFNITEWKSTFCAHIITLEKKYFKRKISCRGHESNLQIEEGECWDTDVDRFLVVMTFRQSVFGIAKVLLYIWCFFSLKNNNIYYHINYWICCITAKRIYTPKSTKVKILNSKIKYNITEMLTR